MFMPLDSELSLSEVRQIVSEHSRGAVSVEKRGDGFSLHKAGCQESISFQLRGDREADKRSIVESVSAMMSGEIK